MDKPVSEMVERACKAFLKTISNDDVYVSSGGITPDGTVVIDGNVDIHAAMTAAIETLREAGEAELNALRASVFAHVWSDWDHDPVLDLENAPKVWQSVIDAALGDANA